VTIGYAISGAETGANSMQFAAGAPLGHEVCYEAGQWTRARIGIFRRTMEFPAPFGRQPMARYGAGEIVTVPRHVDTRAVTALINVGALVPDRRLIPLFPYLRPIVTLVRRTPLRRLLSLAARRTSRDTAQDSRLMAQDASERRFAIVVDVTSRQGRRRRGVIEGGDFHAVTARTLALGACGLASPTFTGRGALAPSMAVVAEELLEALAAVTVSWRVES
jgi:hypothetical protein